LDSKLKDKTIIQLFYTYFYPNLLRVSAVYFSHHQVVTPVHTNSKQG